jgi:hypothetical protein
MYVYTRISNISFDIVTYTSFVIAFVNDWKTNKTLVQNSMLNQDLKKSLWSKQSVGPVLFIYI